MLNPEYIGFIAAILTTSAFLPQAFKIWKNRSADGLSLTMYLVMGTGTIVLAHLWLIDSQPFIYGLINCGKYYFNFYYRFYYYLYSSLKKVGWYVFCLN